MITFLKLFVKFEQDLQDYHDLEQDLQDLQDLHDYSLRLRIRHLASCRRLERCQTRTNTATASKT